MAVWSEISTSQLVGAVRLDAEFWQPSYIEKERTIRAAEHASLGSLVSLFKKGIFYILAREYASSGVPFYRSSNVGAILPKDEGLTFITEAKHRAEWKTALVRGDLMMVKTGKSGASVVLHDRCNVSQDVIAIKVKQQRVNPYFLAVYLNTSFGSSEMNRWFQGQVQPHLSLSDAKRILVALIPKAEQVRIEALVLSSAKARNRANEAWVGAQQLLESELGLDRLSSQKLVGYTARFNELETSRRVDAEHFYPEFESLKAKAPKKVRFVKLRQDLVYCQRGKQPIYARSGLRVINSKHVQVNRLSIDDCRTAIPSSFPGSNIRNGDLLLNGTGVGTIGRAAPYLEDADAIPDNHVTVIRTRTLDPVYLSVFLNSQICQAQVRKHQRGSSGQLELYPRDIARFEVWEAPESVQNEIRQLIIEAYGASSESRMLLEEAKAHVEKLIRQAVTP